MSTLYRAWQFFRAAFGRVRTAEVEGAARYLEPAQMALFRRMPRCDQRHGLDVFATLWAAGERDEALLAAALLHDVGKAGGGLTLWHRVAVVLLGHRVDRWAGDGRGWRAPLAVHVQHAEMGARRAAAVGCAPDMVDLIRRHHDPAPDDRRTAALQWADKRN